MGVNSSRDPRLRIFRVVLFLIVAAKAAGLFCQRPSHESPRPSTYSPNFWTTSIYQLWMLQRWIGRYEMMGKNRWSSQAFAAPIAVVPAGWCFFQFKGSWVHGTGTAFSGAVYLNHLSNIENPIEKMSCRRDNVQVHAIQKRKGTILREGKADRWAPVTSTSISRSATCFLFLGGTMLSWQCFMLIRDALCAYDLRTTTPLTFCQCETCDLLWSMPCTLLYVVPIQETRFAQTDCLFLIAFIYKISNCWLLG